MLDRARRVAQAYRAALLDADKAAAERVDTWALDHGQSWVLPSEWPYSDDELLTIQQVADACHVEKSTVYRWHQRGLVYVVTVDGPRVKAGDLLDFERNRRLARWRQS